VTFQYVSVDEAIKRSGVRIVVLGGVPSPWGEAAKGILHVKNIEWAAVRLLYDSEPLKEWAGQRCGPILMYNNERPRAGWPKFCCSQSASLRILPCYRKTQQTGPLSSDWRTRFAASRGWPGRVGCS
jgi:hypothetical protein